jgi:hypothetical protein
LIDRIKWLKLVSKPFFQSVSQSVDVRYSIFIYFLLSITTIKMSTVLFDYFCTPTINEVENGWEKHKDERSDLYNSPKIIGARIAQSV